MNEKWKESYQDGNRGEKRFIDTAKEHGWAFVRRAKRMEDIREHWDLMFNVNGTIVLVDVKAHKHLWRGGDLQKDVFLVEFSNRIGREGWLEGKSHYIAFEYFDDWYIYRTKALRDRCNELVDRSKIVTRNRDSVNCIYERNGPGKDQTSLVRISDLSNVLGQKWSIPEVVGLSPQDT